MAHALARALEQAGRIRQVDAIGELEVDVVRVGGNGEHLLPQAGSGAVGDQPVGRIDLLDGAGHRLENEPPYACGDLPNDRRMPDQEPVDLRIHRTVTGS